MYLGVDNFLTQSFYLWFATSWYMSYWIIPWIIRWMRCVARGPLKKFYGYDKKVFISLHKNVFRRRVKANEKWFSLQAVCRHVQKENRFSNLVVNEMENSIFFFISWTKSGLGVHCLLWLPRIGGLLLGICLKSIFFLLLVILFNIFKVIL